MKMYRNIFATSGLILALAGILGCGVQNQPQPQPVRTYNPYDERNTTSQSGIGVALGDIDGDEDLDLIVASPSSVRAFINKGGRFEPQTE